MTIPRASVTADRRCRHSSRAYPGSRRCRVRYDGAGTPASSSTRRRPGLLNSSMIRASSRRRKYLVPAGQGCQFQVQLALPAGHRLPGRGLQGPKLRPTVRRPDVLDVSRPAPRGRLDLDRRGTRRCLHRPHGRHQATLRTWISAQICFRKDEYPQVNVMRCHLDPNFGPSQAATMGRNAAKGFICRHLDRPPV